MTAGVNDGFVLRTGHIQHIDVINFLNKLLINLRAYLMPEVMLQDSQHNLRKSEFFEVLIVILVSISPLIPQVLKLVIIMFLTLKNIKYIKKINRIQLFTLYVFISIFIIGFTKDIFEAKNIVDFSPLNIFIPLCILLGCLLSIKYSRLSFSYLISRVTYFLALSSIIFYGIFLLFPSLANSLLTYNYYQTSHKTALIHNVLISHSGSIIQRNTGTASEPGLFQFVLNLGFYYYLKLSKKVSAKHILVYSIAIITTYSTAGLITYALIIFRYFFNNLKLSLILALFVIILSPYLIEIIYYQLNYKLVGSYAFNSRYESFVDSLNFAQNYIFGLGNTGYNHYFSGSIQPSWDSFTQAFLRYGYPLVILLISCLLLILKKDWVVFIIIAVTFTSQGVWFLPLVTLLYFIYQKKL